MYVQSTEAGLHIHSGRWFFDSSDWFLGEHIKKDSCK